MNSKTQFPPETHFHIRWSAGSTLDWEAFGTQAEAEATARRLASPHESYSLAERNSTCERCAAFWREKMGGASNTTPTIYAQSEAWRTEYSPRASDSSSCSV